MGRPEPTFSIYRLASAQCLGEVSVARLVQGSKGDTGAKGDTGFSGGPLIAGGKTKEFIVKATDVSGEAVWTTNAALAVTLTNRDITKGYWSEDDVTLSVDDVVLLAGQNDPKQNGLYRYTGSNQPYIPMGPLRSGEVVSVGGGTFNKGTLWQAIGQYSPSILQSADNKYFTRISPPYDPWTKTAVEISQQSTNLATGTATMAQAMATAALSPISAYYNHIGMVWLRAGRLYTGLQFMTGPTAGSGLTSQWACLVATSGTNYGKIVATCGGYGGTTIAANQSYTHYFSPTFTPLRDELVWIVIVVTGTTMPTFLSAPAHAGNAFNVYSTPNPFGRGAALRSLKPAGRH